ncbi:MAG: hypothetical protein H7841_12850 [Magnetospirillum sp. WYHS-4]
MTDDLTYLFFLNEAFRKAPENGRCGVLVRGSWPTKPDASLVATQAAQAIIDTPDHTPVVQICQNVKDDVPGHDLYLNYEPTELCLGMAWRIKVRRIVYSVPGKFTKEDDPVGNVANLQKNYYILYNPSEETIGTPKAYAVGGNTIEWLKGFKNLPGGTFRDAAWVDPSAALDFTFLAGIKPAGPDLATVSSDLKVDAAAAAIQLAKIDSIFMLLAYALVGGSWNRNLPKTDRKKEGPRPFGNNIGSILVAPAVPETVTTPRQIVGWGLNLKETNPTYHGETLMIGKYLTGKNPPTLPVGSRLYTTLEPCFMCSGYIATTAPAGGVAVVSGQDDPNISAPGKGRSALRRGVNDCSLVDWEAGSDYKLAEFLKSMQTQAEAMAETAPEFGYNQKTIIDFLFGEGAEAAYVDELSVLPLFVRHKMAVRPDAAAEHLAHEVAGRYFADCKKAQQAPALGSVEALGNGRKAAEAILPVLGAYLDYGIAFLNAVAAKGTIQPLAPTVKRVAELQADDPLMKAIPFL